MAGRWLDSIGNRPTNHLRIKKVGTSAEALNMTLAALDSVIDDFASIVQIRTPETSSDSIVEFSHTYDGYGIHGSLERMRTVANRVWETWATSSSFVECELDDLNTALYLTQRGWRSGAMAIEVDVGIEWELVEAINQASGRLVRDERANLR